MIETGDAAAGRVGDADLGILHLMRAGAPFQLAHDLDRLRGTGGADRMSA